ncbi:hypothetical protein MSG37_10555 [Shewanella sp. 1CM18E]|uniref:hypothetical protein n=1 Tax=Shewanella sp. 1CM18E TaxID=2929169 RepID=UPI0020BD5191|nr:hypothetical protein [Shewanella sp. 1CM18E]MCK8045331.1 hypothetical protein [Shewanella sp. 1CM18E]
MKYKIEWPDFFESFCSPSHSASTKHIYVINWPLFISSPTVTSSNQYLGRDRYIIEWPDFFSSETVPVIRKSKSYIIDWPYFFEKIEKDDANKDSSKEDKYYIEWPNFEYLDSYESKIRSQYTSSERSKEENIIRKRDTEGSFVVKETHLEEFVKSIAFDEPERSYYDHSDNLTGLQHVSGHYRRLKNGTIVYISPHKRFRY